MYSASNQNMTPTRRMRLSRHEQYATPQPSPSKAALSVSTKSPKLHGDYIVLKEKVQAQRDNVFQARATLASTLDQLGEHFVRTKEYDFAMDAFAESLHEKRSIYSTNELDGSKGRISPQKSGGRRAFFPDDDDTVEEDARDPTNASSRTQTTQQGDDPIDSIVSTLKNMGNVHSLRGEQDEAMRYYTEVTNLRAQKASDGASTCDGTSLLSGGFDNDTTSLMSEINQDVKALDDLFRSISFRNNPASSSSSSTPKLNRQSSSATEISSSSAEKRKEVLPSPSNKRRKSSNTSSGASVSSTSLAPTVFTDTEPFQRTVDTGNPSTNLSRTDLADSLSMLKNVLQESSGPNQQSFQEHCDSLILRADLLQSQPIDKSADLELALEVYQQVLIIHEESNSSAATSASTTSQTTASSMASVWITMGSIYYKLNDRSKELECYQQAKTIYQNAFGSNHEYVAGARKNIGMVLAELGDYEKALGQFEKAKLIYQMTSSNENSRNVASAISCIGNVQNRRGELEQASEHYMEALSIYKSLYEANDSSSSEQSLLLIDLTNTLKVIGNVHSKTGNMERAMECFIEALNFLQSSPNSGDSCWETVASIISRIASIHLKRGELDESMRFYQQAYDLTIQHVTKSENLASLMHFMGGIAHKRGDFDTAMKMYKQAIHMYHATVGPNHPTVAGTLVMMGSLYYKKRNLDASLRYYKEALRLNRSAYGMHHPDIAPVLKSIGTILTKKGEFREAYDVFRDVLSIKATVHGTNHPEVASAYKSLGNVNYKLGELHHAERHYRHALGIYRKCKGEDHADTQSARTTIEHLRYWMREKEQRLMMEQQQQRQAAASSSGSTTDASSTNDERRC